MRDVSAPGPISRKPVGGKLNLRALPRSLYGWAMRIEERLLGIHVFAINARALDPSAPADALPAGDSIRYLARSDLTEVCSSPELDISRGMATSAFDRGDRCIGYFEQDKVVSYFWCAFGPTPMEAGLWVRFPPCHSYAYKALTLPSHRGRRLQQVLTHASDRALTAEGFTHNIEYIATHNFSQLAASARYGNQTVGYAGYVVWKGRARPFHSRGASAYGFLMFNP